MTSLRIACIAALVASVATQSWALNPQPEPPGKNIKVIRENRNDQDFLRSRAIDTSKTKKLPPGPCKPTAVKACAE